MNSLATSQENLAVALFDPLARVPAATGDGDLHARTDFRRAGIGAILVRALAARVRNTTGQKGRALFHPIRLALTGRSDGPELDLAIPAIDRGAGLPRSAGLPTIVGNRERAAAVAAALAL